MAEGPVHDERRQLEHAWWAVSFIDLLGQQDAFLATDFVPGPDDDEARATLHAAVRDNLKTIEVLHEISSRFAAGDSHQHILRTDSPLLAFPAEVQALSRRWKQTDIRHSAWSDGVVFYSSLQDSDGHFPITGLHNLVAAAGCMCLLLLRIGKPVRGGIDVGTAVETRNQLFGAAVVKAYQLESKHAKHPRVLVGDSVRHYLTTLQNPSSVDVSGQFAQAEADKIGRMVTQDEDGCWMVDYLGPVFRELMADQDLAAIFGDANAFVTESRQRWEREGNEKLARRYAVVESYFLKHASSWGAA